MNLKTKLSEREEQLLDDFLGRVLGGAIPNIEALDGFFTALAWGSCNAEGEAVLGSSFGPFSRAISLRLQNAATDYSVEMGSNTTQIAVVRTGRAG